MNILVLKMGGSILAKLPTSFYQTIVALKQQKICEPIIVHGGGPEINETLKELHVESKFVDGLRVTTNEVLDVAEMVMSGSINKKIVANIQKQGGTAIGMSGVDGKTLQAIPIDNASTLGYVGQVKKVNVSWIEQIMEHGAIPVISPIGIDGSGERLNINGDMAAAAVAKALKAKLALISDIPGVMENVSGKEFVHEQLTKEEIEEKIASGVIYGGMIPKVRSALNGLSGGIKESVILNGLAPEDIKDYIQGKQAGTKVVMKKEEKQHV